MKQITKIISLAVCVFVASFTATQSVAAPAIRDVPLVTITPKRLELIVSTATEKKAEPKSIELTVINRTSQVWQFSKFYDSWSPILATDAGIITQLGLSRDATRLPTAADFPKLAPDESATTNVLCRLVQQEKKIWIVFYDSTGGVFSAPLNSGNYKLCICYRPRAEEVAKARFGLEIGKLWQGWVISDWIDIHIEP